MPELKLETDRSVMELVGWLKQRKPGITEVGLEDDLLNEGHLDSLQFVNFLLFIESLRGSPIPEHKVVPEAFRTLKDIIGNFLREE